MLFSSIPVGFSQEQYKKFGNKGISLIVDGKYEAAVMHYEDVLVKYPGDLESYYGLAIACAQKRQIDKAIEYVEKAVEGGLPFGRFLAGPRDLLSPLTTSLKFRALLLIELELSYHKTSPLTTSPKFKVPVDKYALELLHGPMLGCMTVNGAKFWLRTVHEVPVEVFVKSVGSEEICSRAKGKTNSEHDYTVVLSVNGLKPNTLYDYELEVAGQEAAGGQFCTFPKRNEPAKFQVGFGGGAGYTPQHERMWNTIASRRLTAFLFLGDNVYIDNPTRRAVQQYCYYRRQSRPEYRVFIASTPIFAIWDDHDFTTNDAGGGPLIHTPAWKIPVWRTFTYNWNNPYYAGGLEQPGCWFDFSIGDVDFFMLDGRYYRDDPKSENPSMLGPAQKKWLFGKLKSSDATFKVLASPVPWSYGAKPGSRDPWQGYKAEREQIFSFLEANRIDGVILIAADRHRSDAWRIERENGYDLYEFESSRLTNIHTHKIMTDSLFGYNEKCSFGVLAFETTRDDPQVTYRIVNIDNEIIYEMALKKSQLAHTKAR